LRDRAAGDLARWLPGGVIDFMGRLDNQACPPSGGVLVLCRVKGAVVTAVVGAHQVKLRGFRVELGEIEHALSELPGVQLAAALVLQDPTGSQRLVAYITPASADPAAARADLRERLPAHMVPDVVVPLERMPLLPNEKVDRRALPAPDWGAGAAEEYVAPAGELEAQLQAVWLEVLGRERISAQADFFAVGGNSLQVLLASRLLVAHAGTLCSPATQQLTHHPHVAGGQGDDTRAQSSWQGRADGAAVPHAHHRRPGAGARAHQRRARAGGHPARGL